MCKNFIHQIINIFQVFRSNKILFGTVKNFSLFILLFFFLLPSCDVFSDKGECERIIEEDKMVEIMIDIYLLESYIQVESRSRSSMRDSVDYYYAGLFEKHDVSKETFDKAFECYSLDGEKVTYLQEEVLNSLSIMESEAIEEGIPIDRPDQEDTPLDKPSQEVE